MAEKVKAVPPEMTDAIKRIDAATDAIALELRQLRDQVKTGMTPQEVEAMKAKLLDMAAKAEGIAADPADLVPAPPPA